MKPSFVTALFLIGAAPILAINRVRRAGGYNQGDYVGGDYSAIPGSPGQDYPIYGPHPPKTNFRCAQQPWLPGYYADTQFRCQVFHICEAGGKDSVFLCPNGTLFNQKYFVCDWWYNVNCPDAPGQYGNNGNLYRDVPAVAGYQGSPSRGSGARALGGGGSGAQGGGGAGAGAQGGSGGYGPAASGGATGSGGYGSRSQTGGFGGGSGSGTKAGY